RHRTIPVRPSAYPTVARYASMAATPAFADICSAAGRNESPTANPSMAARAIAAREGRDSGRAKPASAPTGIPRNPRHQESLPIERLHDREDRDERVEREHEEHEGGIEAAERRQKRPDERRGDRDSDDGAEQQKSVAGVPADLRVPLREEQRDHAQEGKIGENEHRAGGNRALVLHARHRTIAA